MRLVEHLDEGATVTRWRGAILVPTATEVVTAFCTVSPLNAKAELIDPASYASGQLMRDLGGRYVVLQSAGVAQKALQHAGSAHCART